MCEKEEVQKISGKKRKRRSIRMEVDLYEVCLSYIIYCLLFYFVTILTPFFFTRFVVSLSPGKRSSGSIGQKGSSRNSTRIQINSGGQSF